MLKLITIAAAALALGAMTLAPASAQMGGQNGTGFGMMGGGCAMMGMMRHGRQGQGHRWHGGKLEAMVEGRLAYLKSELDITDAQKEGWEAYADAIDTRVGVMKGMRQIMRGAMHEGTAVERMEARIQGMESMLEAMKAVKPATEKLYGVLTDAQKKKADQLIGTDCGAM